VTQRRTATQYSGAVPGRDTGPRPGGRHRTATLRGMDARTPRGAARPRRITAAAALLGLQGLVVAGFGVVLLVRLVTNRPEQVVSAATLAVTVLVLSLLPLVAARGLWLSRRWSRSPALVVQLMVLPVAWQLVQRDGVLLVVGLAVGATAIAVLGMLL